MLHALKNMNGSLFHGELVAIYRSSWFESDLERVSSCDTDKQQGGGREVRLSVWLDGGKKKKSKKWVIFIDRLAGM